MSLTPEETAQGDRLATGYNAGDNTATNALGFGRGGSMPPINLFIRALRDLVGFGRGVVRVVLQAKSEAERLSGEAQIAALLVIGGPVSSIQIDDGPIQGGAVKISLAALSASLEQQAARIEAAQDQLAAEQASLRRRSAAYALAFGG